jgi:hypothetical protein
MWRNTDIAAKQIVFVARFPDCVKPVLTQLSLSFPHVFNGGSTRSPRAGTDSDAMKIFGNAKRMA